MYYIKLSLFRGWDMSLMTYPLNGWSIALHAQSHSDLPWSGSYHPGRMPNGAQNINNRYMHPMRKDYIWGCISGVQPYEEAQKLMLCKKKICTPIFFRNKKGLRFAIIENFGLKIIKNSKNGLWNKWQRRKQNLKAWDIFHSKLSFKTRATD